MLGITNQVQFQMVFESEKGCLRIKQTRREKQRNYVLLNVELWDVDNDKENGKKDQRMCYVDMEEDAKNIMDGEED